MSNIIFTKSYDEPEFNVKEILRYSGCKESTESIDALAEECINESRNKFTYRVCYGTFSIEIADDIIDFGCMKAESKGLAKNLNGCDRAIIFGATVGIEIDRLIARYGRVSPSKALMLQSIGAERIESLCDMFCNDMAEEYADENLFLRPRFSPGYGDLPLLMQKDIFRTIDFPKKIGLSLNESLLMSPSKSVTAIVGISGECINKEKNKCKSCQKTDCIYRRTK